MFKNTNSKRMTGILLALVLVTSVFIGGSIARYITSTSSEDEARVAKWGFSETPEPVTMDLFKNEYKLEDSTVVAKSANESENIIAPGLNGVSKFKFVTSSVSPEVMYEVKISVDDSEIADEIKNHPGIQWKVDSGNWVTWDEMVASLVSLSGDPSGTKIYAPGELHDNFKSNAEHTIAWQWVMDSGYDVEDTRLGNLAASGTPITAKIVVTVLAQQTNVDSTGMLEGNGSTVNILDPQPLTFRADDNFEDFETVKVNGTEINEGTDYTVEPGSIKVILTKSFLSTLPEGNNVITIISSNKETKASFRTKKSDVSFNGIIPEGGIYYTDIEYYENELYGEVIDYYNSTKNTIINSGEPFPELKTGDLFVYGDYVYGYNCEYRHDAGDAFHTISPAYNSWYDGWSVQYIGNSSEPGAILSSIEGKDVKSIKGLFADKDITKILNFPSKIQNMDDTFYCCYDLVSIPKIPETVTSMIGTFISCSSLETIPNLPNNLTTLGNMFQYCNSLKSIPNFPNNLTTLSYAFAGLESLKTIPKIIPTSVTNIDSAFSGCTSLEIAPTIPASVTSMNNAFSGCSSLTGTIEINTDLGNPSWSDKSKYNNAFKDTNITWITGSIPGTLMESIVNNSNLTLVDPMAIQNGTIPEGGVYYIGVPFNETESLNPTGYTKKLVAGNKFPTPKFGDIYIYDNVEYRYSQYFDWHSAEDEEGNSFITYESWFEGTTDEWVGYMHYAHDYYKDTKITELNGKTVDIY